MKNMEVIYATKIYRVLVNRQAGKYLIHNVATGITEEEATKLPTAIGMAKGMQAALSKLIKEDESEETSPY